MKHVKLIVGVGIVLGVGVYGLQQFERPAELQELVLRTDSGRSLASDPEFKAQAEQIIAAFKNGTATPQDVEPVFFQSIATLYAKNELKPALLYLVVQARAKGALGDFGKMSNADLVKKLYPMLESELYSRGLAQDGKYKYAEWAAIAKAQDAKLKSAKAGSGVKTEAFKKEISALTGAAFTATNRLELLNDAKQALDLRIEVIRNAKSSLLVLSWAILDDATGNRIADELIARAKKGPIDIKIMVDGQVSRTPGYNGAVAKLEKAKIPTIRWESPTNPFYGQHRKLMIVDHDSAFQGGRNFGDAYYHQGNAPKWRDTDMFFKGPLVTDAEKLFVELWNEQVKKQKKPAAWNAVIPATANAAAGSAQAALVNHSPNRAGVDPIHLATLKAIRSAKESIDISNAYVVASSGRPGERLALQIEILAARKRGVRVRILTNSAKSVDEPIVTYPILSSLKPFLEAGCEIYLKNGDTTHSKYLVVDQAFSWLGSYNLHPRSLQYEGEMVVMSLDAKFADAVVGDYERDLAEAKKAAHVADLGIPAEAAWPFLTLFFFNQI